MWTPIDETSSLQTRVARFHKDWFTACCSLGGTVNLATQHMTTWSIFSGLVSQNILTVWPLTPKMTTILGLHHLVYSTDSKPPVWACTLAILKQSRMDTLSGVYFRCSVQVVLAADAILWNSTCPKNIWYISWVDSIHESHCCDLLTASHFIQLSRYNNI